MKQDCLGRPPTNTGMCRLYTFCMWIGKCEVAHPTSCRRAVLSVHMPQPCWQSVAVRCWQGTVCPYCLACMQVASYP